MAIDTSMYGQNPVNQGMDAFSNVMSNAANMMKLSQLARTNQEQQAVKDAFKNNVVQGQDGTPQVNQSGLMSDLAKASPEAFMQYQSQLANQAKARQEMQLSQLNLHKQQLEMMGQVAGSINDQPSYERGLQLLKQNGVDVSDAPPQYDKNWVDFHTGLAMTLKDKLANKISQQEANAKTLEAKAAAANAGIPTGGSGGSAAGPTLAKSGKASPNLVAQNGPGGASGPQQAELSDIDPATLLSRVPMKDREKVATQIDTAKNAVQNGPKILSSFDQAYKSHPGIIDYIPGTLNADQKAFHALMGPTFKDVEGTVRQAAMDNMFSSTTPQFGDRADSRTTKRNAVKNYLQDKTSASLAKSYGIDLSKFKSTNVQAALDATNEGTSNAPQGATKTWNGKTYKIVGDHWVAQ